MKTQKILFGVVIVLVVGVLAVQLTGFKFGKKDSNLDELDD